MRGSHRIRSGINRIRLEFKGEKEMEAAFVKSRINRIRLEFKVRMDYITSALYS